ncbi:hypothetical protein [Streptomyces purpurogeneiscleroticus]|uniref:hypothetical protein n=1 Tax=Streptomyces purpurogeneiscleroticus TaxID=68259 RepID=UPI001CBB3808|nr:hypothetical protein [Streptomyces purpurogeneiscleroticus]MBZ4014608.1 hypothetical protein [Streptomyces purpurogeneiscleroticus]
MSSHINTPPEPKTTGRARHGASAVAHDTEHRHPVGNALRAVKVFAGTAFSVAVLGEYADDSSPTTTRTKE